MVSIYMHRRNPVVIGKAYNSAEFVLNGVQYFERRIFTGRK